MATVEIDLAFVLSAYSATLKQPSKTLVRDSEELRHALEAATLMEEMKAPSL
jgi:hypothetical protein